MIIQCDFDGTIITTNMSALLKEAFALDGWRSIEAEYARRGITVEESNRRQFLLVRQSRETIESFVHDHTSIRPGFIDFIQYCRRAGIRFVIVSAGLDLYIRPILKAMNLSELETFCARTTFGAEGVVVKYFDPIGQPVQSGFKRCYLTWLKSRGEPLTYVGDGLSDLDAAVEADNVFATGHLCTLLGDESIQHSYFESFDDIRERMPSITSKSRDARGRFPEPD